MGGDEARVALAGSLSGTAQVAAEYPFDTVKVRLQSNEFAFRGPIDCLTKTLRHEGVRALYQGVAPRLLTYGLVKLSLFSIFERVKAATNGSTVMGGAVAGACNVVVSCPIDVIKSRLQVTQAVSGSARSLWAPFLTSLRAHGPGVLYLGALPHATRDAIGYALLYTAYDYLKRETSLPAPICGGLSGMVFYLSTLPIDRVKTILQTQSLSKPTYTSSFQCLRFKCCVEGLALGARTCQACRVQCGTLCCGCGKCNQRNHAVLCGARTGVFSSRRAF